MTTHALPLRLGNGWTPGGNHLPAVGLLVLVAAVLWAFVAAPMLLTLQRSIDAAGIDAYLAFGDIWSGAVPQALLGSIVISIASVITAGVTGIALAVLLGRWEFPLRRLLHALILSPLALPPFMGAAAFAKLYGLGGVVPSFLARYVFDADANAFALQGAAGVLLVHTVTMYPFFYLPVSAALREMDASLEDAAASLGASALQTWSRVVLPMLTPAIVAGSLLTFMSSMSSYTAPMLFGVSDVLTRQIVLANENADIAFAAAAAVVLCLFSLAFLLIFRLYEKRSAYWTSSKGGARKHLRRVSGFAQAGLLVASALTAVFMLLPLLLIFVLAFSVDGSWRDGVLPAEYGIANIAALFNESHAWRPVVNSVQISAVAACAATVLGLCSAYLVARGRRRGTLALEIAIMLPWALPGTVVAYNLVTAFNQPSLYTFGCTLVGTWSILPLAYLVRFTPLVFRSTAASLAQIDPALEDAARSLGASSWCSFRRIVLPLVLRGLVAGALLTFVAGLGEFVATTMLHAQEKYKPLSIAIFEEYSRGNIGTASAWGVVQIVLVLACLLLARRIESGADRAGVNVA